MRQRKFTIIIITFLILSASPLLLTAQSSSEQPILSHDSCSAILADSNHSVDSNNMVLVETGHALSPLIPLALLKGIYYKNISILQSSVISQKDSIISSLHSLISKAANQPTVVYKTNWAVTALCTSLAFIINWTIYLLLATKK